jgi:hypothetical protein
LRLQAAPSQPALAAVLAAKESARCILKKEPKRDRFLIAR